MAHWTVKIVRTSKGSLLVGPNGHTVYLFTHDRRNHDSCVSISGCKGTWPLLYVTGRPVAGPGARASLLSTITVGGRHQVTYAGWPLYYYSGDSGAASTSYLGFSGFGGTWYGVSASGGRVPHPASGGGGGGGGWA
jgi:predicted lipoprotein with Yx(FWY)xxD motif